MTTDELLECLRQNVCVRQVLENTAVVGLKNWYVGAGAICQTIWNIKHGNKAEKHIKDIDLVYFDRSDLAAAGEQVIRERVQNTFSHLTIPIDVTNQARVHLWYADEFGFETNPYQSSEDAIDSWPTTASAIGVRQNTNSKFEVYAPFGLADMGAMIVRPNKRLVTKAIYESKAMKWKQLWPMLTVINW